MKMFVRMTKLSNIQGRANYVLDVKKQESIVAASPPVNWKPYQRFERANRKTNKKNNEGREVIIALPNGWAELPRDELIAKVQTLAVIATKKKSDMQWAVHWNKTRTNLHMHVIFSERQRVKNAGKYDRDIYLTEMGKVARRKADRAKDTYGKDMPPVHRKGDSKGEFSAKDVCYKNRAWIRQMKISVREQMEGYGVIIEPRGVLYQYHQGKGSDASKIALKNDLIRKSNPLLRSAQRKFQISSEDMKKVVRVSVKNIKQGLIPAVQRGEAGLVVVGLTSDRYNELGRLARAKLAQNDNELPSTKRENNRDIGR